jgi:hypothetical protein
LASSTTTTPRPASDQRDEKILRAATERELRNTGNADVANAEVAEVDIHGSWAITSIVPLRGYGPGYVLFRKTDGKWAVAIGLTHQFIISSLPGKCVPPEMIDLIRKDYPTSPD